MSDAADQDGARIYDQGYRPFQGELASPRSRFWAITANELRLAWKEKWFRRLVWLAFMPMLVFCVLVVVSTRFPVALGSMGSLWIRFWGLQLFFAVLVVYFVGRRAVGEDIRTGAMTVYFSRPVSFNQYLAGKWLAIAIGVVAVTLVPGIVLALFAWLARPNSVVLDFLDWLAVLVVLSGLGCLTLGAVMLAVSSLTQRGRAAGIVWMVMFFVLGGAAQALAHSTGLESLEAVSFTQANVRLADLLFQGHGSLLDGLWFVLGQVVWMAAGFSVVLLRLRTWKRA